MGPAPTSTMRRNGPESRRRSTAANRSELFPAPATPVIRLSARGRISSRAPATLFRLSSSSTTRGTSAPGRGRETRRALRRSPVAGDPASATGSPSRARRVGVSGPPGASSPAGGPLQRRSPPCGPGPGPRSTSQSAARASCRSWSTTTTVCPWLRSRRSTPSSLPTSRGWSPALGSSSTISSPRSSPSASGRSRRRCASAGERVGAARSNDRYPRPSSSRSAARPSRSARIGARTGCASGSVSRNARRSRAGSAASSVIARPCQRTARASGRRRAPAHSRHGRLRTYRRMESFRFPRRISSMTGSSPR